MKSNRLAVFASSLQCTDEVKGVLKGTPRSRTSVTWGIWWLASAAEKDGERGGKFPTVRHEHLLGLICRSHSPADSHLYADDVKRIAPRNRHDILQSSLNVSANWSKDWELDLNPTKSKHLPIGNSPRFVTYILPPQNPPKTQTIPKVSTTKGLGIVLNTRLSTENNVVSAANKARRMLFYLKRSFATLTPSIFLPLYNFSSGHIFIMLFKHPILSRGA